MPILPLPRLKLLGQHHIHHIQYSPVNSGSGNSENLLIQTGDYGPYWAHYIYTLYLGKFIIRTNLLGPPEFEFSGLHCKLNWRWVDNFRGIKWRHQMTWNKAQTIIFVKYFLLIMLPSMSLINTFLCFKWHWHVYALIVTLTDINVTLSHGYINVTPMTKCHIYACKSGT